jgi:cyclohexanone monooxygenase
VGGKTLKDVWLNGVCTYLGVGVPGFPNFFMIGGPESPSVLTNVVMSNEYQVEWISKLIHHLNTHQVQRCDVHQESADKWSQTVKDVIKGTVLEGADSWYVGTNVPGKKRGILAYAGGIKNYIAECDRVAQSSYQGFEMS